MKCEYIGCASTATTACDSRTYCGQHANKYAMQYQITDDQGNE